MIGVAKWCKTWESRANGHDLTNRGSDHVPGSPSSFFCRSSLQRSPKFYHSPFLYINPISFPNFQYSISVDPPSPSELPGPFSLLHFYSSTAHHYASICSSGSVSHFSSIWIPLCLSYIVFLRPSFTPNLRTVAFYDLFGAWFLCAVRFFRLNVLFIGILICWSAGLGRRFVFFKALSLWICLVKLRGFNSLAV